MTTLTIAVVQHDIAWEEAQANIAARSDDAVAAARAGAGLIVFSEMFTTGFSMAAARLAESPGGAGESFLVDTARRHRLWVSGSMPHRTPGFERPTNRFLLAGPSGELHGYSKMRPFAYADEHEHYSAGVERLTVAVNGVRVTPFVCYDLRFADLFWDAAGETDCYVVAANWPAARRHHWTALLQARAIENQAYVVGVNRVGVDGNGLAYAGDSAVFDPLGVEVARAGSDAEMLIVDVESGHVADVRERFPFLADR